MRLYWALIVALADIHQQIELIRDIAKKASRARVVFVLIIIMIVFEPVFNQGEDSIAFALFHYCFSKSKFNSTRNPQFILQYVHFVLQDKHFECYFTSIFQASNLNLMMNCKTEHKLRCDFQLWQKQLDPIQFPIQIDLNLLVQYRVVLVIQLFHFFPS